MRWRTESGAAAIELVIVLPLLIALAGGVVEFGAALLSQQRIQEAVEEGTVQFSRFPGDPASALQATVDASNGDLTSADVTLACHAVGSSEDVEVSAAFDHDLILTGFLPFIPATITLEALARTASLDPDVPCDDTP